MRVDLASLAAQLEHDIQVTYSDEAAGKQMVKEAVDRCESLFQRIYR